MTSPRSPLLTRRIALLLRDGLRLEGDIHVGDGQSLTVFLGMRRHYLNVTGATWAEGPEGETMAHLGVRVDRIIWAVPLEATLSLTSADLVRGPGREVELRLVDGSVVHVKLHIAAEQRMSDYFDANPTFVPLYEVRIVGSGERIERMAVSHEAIATIREL